MLNRVLVVGSLVVIFGVATLFATSTFSTNGDNVNAKPQSADTMTTDDVPARPSAGRSAPAPRDVASAAEIGWYRSFDDARSSAKPGQVIFVDVYTDWCGWCKYMDQRVFTHTSVKQFAQENVFVKIDAEDNAEGTAFARKNGVRGFPTLMVFSSDGQLIDKQSGAFRNPADFVNWLEASASSR